MRATAKKTFEPQAGPKTLITRDPSAPATPIRLVDAATEEKLAWAFPAGIDPLHAPCSSYILVQMRRQKAKVGRIHLPGESRDVNRDNEQVARVVAFGPLAYLNRDTLQPWPEGAWCAVGDFVRVPRYGKEAWRIELPGEEEPVVFNIIKDTDVIARVTDPLAVKAYV